MYPQQNAHRVAIPDRPFRVPVIRLEAALKHYEVIVSIVGRFVTPTPGALLVNVDSGHHRALSGRNTRPAALRLSPGVFDWLRKAPSITRVAIGYPAARYSS